MKLKEKNKNTDIALVIMQIIMAIGLLIAFIFTVIYLPIHGKFVIGIVLFGSLIIVIYLIIELIKEMKDDDT